MCAGHSIPVGQFDTQHCGLNDACVACPDPQLPHAQAACADRTHCSFACAPLWDDCNHLASDGCETSIGGDDVNNCGACGQRCHGTCAGGICNSRFLGEGAVTALIGAAKLDLRTSAVVPHLIWTRLDGGTLDVRAVKLDGTEPVTLASVPAGPGVAASLALDGEVLYWTTGSAGGGAVYRMPFTGSPGTPTLLATGQDGPGNVLVTDGGVYWSNTLGGQIMQFGPSGLPQTIASGQPRPGSLAADDEQLYWVNQGTDGGDGAVMAMARTGGPPTSISADSHFPDGRPTRTAAAPTGISIETPSPFQPQFAATNRVVVWADGPSRSAWGWTGGAPFPVTYPTVDAWDPVQVFGFIQHFQVFNRAAHWLFDSGPYIPGDFTYDGPFHPEGNLLSRWPAAARIVSTSPVRGSWTDGSTVESFFCIQSFQPPAVGCSP